MNTAVLVRVVSVCTPKYPTLDFPTTSSLIQTMKTKEKNIFIPSCYCLYLSEMNVLLGDGESAEAAFNRHIHCNKDLFAHHDKLQAMLQVQSKVKEINEAREKQKEFVIHQ